MSAIISECGRYRYALVRDVLAPDDGGACPTLLWVMVNPSTADATEDDATIRKCVGFARRWGFGRIAVVNLWAFRSKDVEALSYVTTPPTDYVGPENDQHIREWASAATSVMVAWGAREKMPRGASKRIATVAAILSDAHREPLWSLGTTQSGDPRHPLMPSYATARVAWPLTTPALVLP
jgi:hypothetical protein